MNLAKYRRPSGAATWSVCSGYVAMCAAYPELPAEEIDNEVREDGTACHWLAAEVWEGRHPEEGSLSPNGRIITDEMYDAVDLYHDTLRKRDDAEWHIEKTMSCDVVAADMEGTPDAWSYRPGWLRVADLKFGFRFVEVWENLQLVIYACAIAKMLKLDGECMVELTIVQPRSYHREGQVRTWTTKLKNLYPILKMLQERAHAAGLPNAPCTPNPGCTDCPGRHACVALQQSSMSAIEQAYGSVPLELPPAAVGSELRRLKEAAKKIEARITGLSGQAEGLLRSGKVVPGWDLVTARGRERWKDGAQSHVLTLGRYYNADLQKPPTPISPAQARKLLPADVVAIYAIKPETGMKLVPQDKFAAAKKFGGVSNEP